MRRKNMFVYSGMIVLGLIFLLQCSYTGTLDETMDTEQIIESEEVYENYTNASLKINLSDALALFTRDSEMLQRHASRNSDAVPQMESPLAKVLSDGTVENVLELIGDDLAMIPNIRFVAIGNNNDVYIYFEYSFHVYNADTDSHEEIQFIQITQDNEYHVIENNGYIQDFNWHWGAGSGQDPVIFDDNGAIYYTIWQGNNLKLKKYYNGESIVFNNAGNVEIEAFFTDGTNLFFLGRNVSQDNQAYFLRMITQDQIATNLFYKTSGNCWIRDVKRWENSILLHGYNIPYRYEQTDAGGEVVTDESGDPILVEAEYEGLIKLTINEEGIHEFLPIIGMEKGEQAFKDHDQFERVLSKKAFFNESGEVNYDLLHFIIKPFFINGIVPDAVDYFAPVTIDRNAIEMADFNNREDVYFWYKLLHQYEGFDQSYIDRIIDDSDYWRPLFPESGDIGRHLWEWLFYDEWGRRISIPDDSSVLSNTDGTVNLDAFKLAVQNSEYIQRYFTDITVKDEVTGAQIPTTIFSDWNDMSGFKTYLDEIFNYTAGSRDIEYFDMWQIFDQHGDHYQGAALNYQEVNGADTLLFDLKLALNQDAFDPDTFTYKVNNEGISFNPLTDKTSSAERAFLIAWEWEENDPAQVYDKVGILGRYRIINDSWDERNFISNFFTYTPVIEGIQVTNHSSFYNLLLENGSVYDINTLFDADSSDTSDDMELLFKQKIIEYTNIIDLTYKELNGSKLCFFPATTGITYNERNRKLIWEGETGYVAENPADGTGILGNYQYDATDTSYSDTHWIFNFFTVSEGPRDIGWINLGNFLEEGAWEGSYEPRTDYQNVSALISQLAADTTIHTGNATIVPEITLKTLTNPLDLVDTIAFDPAVDMLSDYEMNYNIHWEWEENDALQDYPHEGVLGNYRLVNAGAEPDSRWFVYNFFDVVTPDYNLGNSEDAASLSENEDLWEVMNAFKHALYTDEKHGGIFTYKKTFLNTDGTLATDKVLSVLNKYSDNPSITTGSKKVFFEDNYIVYDPETGQQDWEATRSNFVTTIFGLSTDREFPKIIAHNNWWDYTSDPHFNAGSAHEVLEFWNLDQFSISDTGDIFGLFKQHWDSNVYDIARLMDSTNTVMQEIILSDIEASAVKVMNNKVFYINTNFNGVQSLIMNDLSINAPVTLIDSSLDLEIFKYNISDDLSTIYFTAQRYNPSSLAVGSVSIDNPDDILFKETDGISTQSDIEIFNAN